MQRARAFFYVCAGVFLLALSFHLGAQSARAQAPNNPIVCETNGVVVTANGDVYATPGVGPQPFAHWVYAGNVFGGAPTATTPQTWGQIKAKYR
jgi:hypothetical protein